MFFYSKFIMLTVLLASCGCTDTVTIQNLRLRDRVIACSAGLSNYAGVSLTAAFDKMNLNGELNTEFKDTTQSVIFDELPVSQRLQAYHDYIKCVESHWDDHTLIKSALRHKRLELPKPVSISESIQE